MLYRLLPLCLFFFCRECLFSIEKHFDNKVLYLLDERNNTYFFRGKLPLNEGEFCYEELKSQIKCYLSECNKPISENFKLMCVSLLNSFAERKEYQMENKWFSCNPGRGWFWRYPLFGNLLSPHYIPAQLRQVIYFTDPDGIRYFLNSLNKLFNYEYGEDVVLYMHCKVGKDRTGEAAACYLMQYKGYSYQEAMSLNQKIARRKLRLPSINAIRWHAYYLRDVCHLPSIGQID